MTANGIKPRLAVSHSGFFIGFKKLQRQDITMNTQSAAASQRLKTHARVNRFSRGEASYWY
tara:strand:- start:265 stop:447 length:183 start_codon:yes stop_codon:yes gene_type:complete